MSLKKSKSDKSTSTKRNKSRNASRATLEYSSLEDRRVLATFVSLDAGTGVVQINGDTSNNEVVITASNGQLSVQTNDSGTSVFSFASVSQINFSGGSGDDSLTNSTTIPMEAYGHSGNDNIQGGFGNDTIHGGSGDDVLGGGSGDDVIRGSDGVDTVSGHAGNDTLFGGQQNDFLYGGNGNDFINGEHGNDDLFGHAGDDTLLGFAGDDYISGDAGDDISYGQAGVDEMFGGEGNDRVRGNPGNDELHGGNGNDFLLGDQGDDILYGDAGSDDLLGFDGADMLYGGDGNDRLYGQNGGDEVFGESGNDVVRGNADDDMLYGGAGNDSIIGDDGNDRLFGEAGADTLNGGAGADGLVAGDFSVNDTLIGGSGADRFIAQGNDNITDSQTEDATLNFVNETSNWTDAELEVIDNGLALLHQRLGNTTLLKDSLPSGELTFYKYDQIDGGQTAGINSLSFFYQGQTAIYERQIQIADWDESNEFMSQFYTAVTIHELGHNWDSAYELEEYQQNLNGMFDDFLAISGWTESNPGSGFTRSLDGQWFYQSSASFAESYGRTNPYEDLATVWEYYFEHYENTGMNHGAMQAKFDWAESFFDALAS